MVAVRVNPLLQPPQRVATVLACVVASIAVLAPIAGCGREPASTAPTGEVLYLRHCASCHGIDGAGGGALADSLRVPPSDLTGIAQRDGGRFDHARVMAVIHGKREVAAHGPREMPVWGVVFEQEQAGHPYGKYVGLLHARALTDHVATLQR